VEEIKYAQQSDLLVDSCVILDPGFPSKVFVWIGKGASDVVIKMTRKSVDVWLRNLNDGRGLVFTSKNGASEENLTNQEEGDLCWIKDGQETAEFKKCFPGGFWEERQIKIIGNSYTRNRNA